MRTAIDRMVREYKTLVRRERYLTKRMPGKHVYGEYPFPETSGREAAQDKLQDVRRKINSLPGLIMDEISGEYIRQLSKLDAEYQRTTDAGKKADILRERAVIIQKLRHSNLTAELDDLIKEPRKHEKRLPNNGAVMPGHPAPGHPQA